MLRCWEMRTRDNTIEGCIFPTIHSNRNTYPGQTCIVDAGSLINSAIWQIGEHEFEIDAVHLRCPEILVIGVSSAMLVPGSWQVGS